MAYISKPFNDDFLKNLQRLQGEFRPVNFDARKTLLFNVLLLVVSFVGILDLFRRHSHASLEFRVVSSALIGVLALVIVARNWYEAGDWYKFGSGQVQKLSRSGAMRWEEEVLGIVGGTMSTDTDDNAFLTLRWAHSKHRVDIDPSIAEALKAMEAPRAPPSVPLDLELAVAAASDAPVGPSWRCRSCGEENPGSFESCWKCQAERASSGK